LKRRLLAVAANPGVAGLIRRLAGRHALVLIPVASPGEALAELSAGALPDLLVAEDGNGCDGVGLLRRVRRMAVDVLIMIIARKGEGTALRAFREGADDVVFPQSSPEEISARLGVMIRRLGMAAGAQRILPRLTLDHERMLVVDGRREIALTATEFQILHLLARKSGRTLTRSYLTAQIWNTNTAVRTRSIDMHVSHLRRKLGSSSFRIVTIRPAGYRLEPVSTR
jgi:DNA-binding response OmpR family regulator